LKKKSLFPSRQQLPKKKFNFFLNLKEKKIYKFFRVRADAAQRCRVRADAVFTASVDGKNPSADKTASVG
jgi:hypothetical protein